MGETTKSQHSITYTSGKWRHWVAAPTHGTCAWITGVQQFVAVDGQRRESTSCDEINRHCSSSGGEGHDRVGHDLTVVGASRVTGPNGKTTQGCAGANHI